MIWCSSPCLQRGIHLTPWIVSNDRVVNSLCRTLSLEYNSRAPLTFANAMTCLSFSFFGRPSFNLAVSNSTSVFSSRSKSTFNRRPPRQTCTNHSFSFFSCAASEPCAPRFSRDLTSNSSASFPPTTSLPSSLRIHFNRVIPASGASGPNAGPNTSLSMITHLIPDPRSLYSFLSEKNLGIRVANFASFHLHPTISHASLHPSLSFQSRESSLDQLEDCFRRPSPPSECDQSDNHCGSL